MVGLQSDFDRILFELLRGDAEAPHVRANVQRLLLVDVEVHVNRSGLDDGGELGGAIGPHQLSQRHEARRDNPVKGSLHLRITKVERGLRDIDLCLLEPRPCKSRLAVALSSACFDATWRLASSACRSYSASARFNVACAPAYAARACSSLSLYGSGSMMKRVAPSFTWSPFL